jgi:hypothetical protein
MSGARVAIADGRFAAYHGACTEGWRTGTG